MAVNININFNGMGGLPAVTRDLDQTQPIIESQSYSDPEDEWETEDEWEDEEGLETDWFDPDTVPVMFGLEPVPRILGVSLLERAKGKGKGKGKNCEKGQVCGLSCISKTKTCKKDLPPKSKAKAKTAASKTSSKAKGGGGTTAVEPEPKWMTMAKDPKMMEALQNIAEGMKNVKPGAPGSLSLNLTDKQIEGIMKLIDTFKGKRPKKPGEKADFQEMLTDPKTITAFQNMIQNLEKIKPATPAKPGTLSLNLDPKTIDAVKKITESFKEPK